MSTPVIPVAAGTPAETITATVVGKRSWRTTVLVALAALATLYFATRTQSGEQSTFRFTSNVATWFTLPDVKLPATLTLWLFAVALLAAAGYAGWSAWQRGRIPLWFNLAVGFIFIVGFLTWIAAGRSTVIPVISLLAGALTLSIPLIFGALSGIVCERSGIINIAIEGQLLLGAFAAAVVASYFAQPYLGLVAAPMGGAIVGALLAWFAVKYQVNQIIIGVVLNTLIIGLTGFLFATVLSQDSATWNTRQGLGSIQIPLLKEIPVLGPILFNQSLLVYLMFGIVIALQIMLFHSRWGLRTRAVGEHPKAADTVGIAVNKRRVWNTILGGAIAGLGGAFFTVGSGLAFGREMSAGNGFIALAAMILGKWNPTGAIMAALLFGFSKNLGNVISTTGASIDSNLLLMLPYVITIFAVAGFVGRVRPPAAEGIPYSKQ